MIEFICTGRYKRIIDFCCSYRCSAHYCLVQDYSGMPTTLREAVACGSTDVTSFITQHCNKAAEKVSRDNFVFYNCLIAHLQI